MRAVDCGVDRGTTVSCRLLSPVPGEPLEWPVRQFHPVDVTLDRRHGEVAARRIDGEAGDGGPRYRGDDPGAVDPADASLVDVAEVEVAVVVEDEAPSARSASPAAPGRRRPRYRFSRFLRTPRRGGS